MFKRKNPVLMFTTNDDDGGSGTTPTGNDDSGKPKGSEFPADTAVKDMTPEQQAAYWKYQSRKHEDRVKAYGNVTPDQALKAAEDQEEARKKALSDSDRAIEEAVERTRKESATTAANGVADAALRMALRGRVIDGALAFNRPSFVNDGVADLDALEAWVDANSTPAGGGKGHANLGQGNRETFRTTGRASGRAEAEKRFGKKS